MNIYIPIEIKLRELEGRTLLAAVAAERGHTVILGGKEDTLALAKSGKLPPGVIHQKSITPSEQNIHFLTDLKSKGFIVTSQDEEHGLLEESYTRFAKKRFSNESLSQVKLCFTWGEHDYQCLRNVYPDFKDRFINSGSPRVDFWRDDFFSYFSKGCTSCFAKQKELSPYVLIASNFGTFLNENRFWNIIDKQRSAGFFERKPADELYLYDIYAHQSKLIKEFVIMIREIANYYSDINIIIRPHPIESYDAWMKLIGRAPNVIITREDTISGWIRNAIVLIHNGCTTAFEAAASNVPRIAYRPVTSELERDMPNRLSHQLYNIDEVITALKILKNGNPIPGNNKITKLTEEIIKSRFSNLEGKLAADHIVDHWELVGSSLNNYTLSPGKFLLKTLHKRIKDRALCHGKSFKDRFLFNGSEEWGFKTAHKFPALEENELEKLMDNLRSSLNRFTNVRYQKFGRRSFIFYND